MEALEKLRASSEEKMDIDSPPSVDVLSTLPVDISKHAIGSFLEPCEKASLRVASHFFNNLNRSNNGEGLLQAVVYGDLKTVKAILACDPKGELLLKPYRVTDYSGRCIHQTAYQAALAAEDEEMAALIQDHFLRCHGPDLVRAQQEALFPKGEEKAWEVRQQNDLKALNTIIEAIAQATVTKETGGGRSTLKMDERCERAMTDFRKHLDACKDNPMTTGRHWNAALLLRAFTLYTEKFNQFGGESNSPKNLLFWRQVIGSIQRYAPANYAQAFAQGLYHIVEEHKQLRRSFDFRVAGDGGPYFPLDSNPLFRLGYDYASVPLLWSAIFGAGRGAQFFSAFLSGKNSKIIGLMQHPGATSGPAFK